MPVLARAMILLGAVAVALYLMFNAQRWLMPARALNLIDTTWRVESVDGSRLGNLTATMAMSLDRAVLDSECGMRTFGYDLDSDDVGIDFWVLSAETRSCSGTAVADEQRIVTTLLATTHWRVDTDDAIELKGDSALRLTR